MPEQRTSVPSEQVSAGAGVLDGEPGIPGRPRGTGWGLRWLTYLVIMPVIAVTTTVFGCASLLCSLWDRRGRQQHAIARVWARCLLVAAGSPVQVVNGERLLERTAVYASNHLSYMDTPVLFAKLPFQFRILAKQSLWAMPVIGGHLRRSGQVAVDQSSSRTAISSLARGVAALKADMPLVVFPEGGRSADGGVQSFLAGAAFMAIRAQTPIVPLTLVGTFELLPMQVYHMAPRPLMLIVGQPITTGGLHTRDAEALTERIRQEIEGTYMRYSAR